MMKKTTLLAVFMASTALYAQNSDGLKTRSSLTTNSNAKMTKILKNVENPTEYGTRVDILKEDFSKMASGSLDEPDLETVINDYEMKPNAWENILPQYTQTPNWGSRHVYCAGGHAAMIPEDGGASLNTPMLDGSKYDGVAFIEFKIRTGIQQESNNLVVEGAETNNMTATWRFLKNKYLIEGINDQWQTYTVRFDEVGPTTIFNFALMQRQQGEQLAPVFFDELNVFQIKPYVGMPTMLPHTNYKGSSFTANWTAVEGAESYLLNVYAVEEETGVKTYLYQNESVTGNSFEVKNAISGETYYYDAQAVKGDKKSFLSPNIEVFNLEIPKMFPSTIKDGKYTAKWDESPSAERYNYMASYDRVAKADGEFVVTKEDFTGVTDTNGNLTGWTVENPDSHTYGDFYLKELKQAGWHLKNGMPYTDFVCVDGYQYVYNKEDAGLVSPELDLSKDGGKFNVSVKLYGVIGSIRDANNVEHKYQTQCAIALFNFNKEKGDYEQAELIYPEGVKEAWQDFTVQFTKGSAISKIGFYAVRGPENLYIDDVKITQNYKAGESLRDPFLFSRFYEGLQMDVTLPGFTSGEKIYHKVNAVKTGKTGVVETGYCDYEFVGVSDAVNGIGNLSLASATVQVIDGKIIVNNPEGNVVNLYSVDGAQVAADNSGNKEVVFNAARGSYIVKVGKQSVKLTF